MARKEVSVAYGRVNTWQRFRQNRTATIALGCLFGIGILALLADILATRHPWYAKYQGRTMFPAFTMLVEDTKTVELDDSSEQQQQLVFERTDWKQLELESVVWAPIPYSANEPDPFNRNYTAPFGDQLYRTPEGEVKPLPARFWHILGTDAIGRDVAAGLLHGAQQSLGIGVIAMVIATVIGIVAGALAGYYGDRGLRTAWVHLLSLLAGVLLASFYGLVLPQYTVYDAFADGTGQGLWALGKSLLIFTLILSLFDYAGRRLARIPALSGLVHIPLDGLVLRLMELLRAIPALILLIAIRAITGPPSPDLLMLLIGLVLWTGIARFTRAELFRNRTLNYIEAARALGYSERRIVWRHAIPNSLAPVFTAIAFGIAVAILTASSLSFLGLGVSQDTVTWGSLLRAGQERFTAWWLVVFPGMAIFLTVLFFNLVGEGLRDATDPSLKN